MFFAIAEETRQRAKAPHELAMVNLLLCNLLLGITLLAGSLAPPDSPIARYHWPAVALTLSVSLILIGYTRLRAVSRKAYGHWFVAVHWRLASRRNRLLLGAYLVCAAILAIGILEDRSQADIETRIQGLSPAMQQMERRKLESQHMAEAIWSRIGVVPLLLAVMVGIMLESGSIYQAGRGEVPDELVARFPPPPDLTPSDRSG